jgi:hypothetical protein
MLNLFLADPGFLDSIEKALLFRVLLSVAGFIWAVFRMAIPFSAVRFLSLKRAPAPDWCAHGYLSAECCSGTLRHHAKICHSEIGGHSFLGNELVSLVKEFLFVYLSYIAWPSKVQCHRYPKRNV